MENTKKNKWQFDDTNRNESEDSTDNNTKKDRKPSMVNKVRNIEQQPIHYDYDIKESKRVNDLLIAQQEKCSQLIKNEFLTIQSKSKAKNWKDQLGDMQKGFFIGTKLDLLQIYPGIEEPHQYYIYKKAGGDKDFHKDNKIIKCKERFSAYSRFATYDSCKPLSMSIYSYNFQDKNQLIMNIKS